MCTFYGTPKKRRGDGRIDVTFRRVRVTIIDVGKARSLSHSECMSVALVNKYAMSMPPIILPSVACLALPYFPILSHKRHDFREESYCIKCVF